MDFVLQSAVKAGLRQLPPAEQPDPIPTGPWTWLEIPNAARFSTESGAAGGIDCQGAEIRTNRTIDREPPRYPFPPPSSPGPI